MAETKPVLHDDDGAQQLSREYDGRRAQVYCTNGSRLDGTVRFMPGKLVEVVRDGQRSALVNRDYIISMALEKA